MPCDCILCLPFHCSDPKIAGRVLCLSWSVPTVPEPAALGINDASFYVLETCGDEGSEDFKSLKWSVVRTDPARQEPGVKPAKG